LSRFVKPDAKLRDRLLHPLPVRTGPENAAALVTGAELPVMHSGIGRHAVDGLGARERS
jgi:hypothetical protein